jgi:hypothetical protein
VVPGKRYGPTLMKLESEGRPAIRDADPMVSISIATLLLLISTLIDMRRFKEMDGYWKSKTIAPFFLRVHDLLLDRRGVLEEVIVRGEL